MDLFATTPRGIIARASAGAQDALGDFCRTYWRPLYVFFRASGRSTGEAEDLTQSLFASLLVPGELAAFDPERGRFRCWLRGVARNLLLNDLKRARARKRGAGWSRIDFDFETGEHSFQMERSDALDPDRLFDRSWAAAVAARVVARVRADFEGEGKGAAYQRLVEFVLRDDEEVSGDEESPCDKSSTAIRTERCRLTKQIRGLRLRYLREEIGATVASPSAIDDEIRVLFDALEGRVRFDAPK